MGAVESGPWLVGGLWLIWVLFNNIIGLASLVTLQVVA
jgi:hypothetical protein